MSIFRSTRQKAMDHFHHARYARALPLLHRLVLRKRPSGLDHILFGACVAHVTGDDAELARRCRLAQNDCAPDVLLRLHGSVLFDFGRHEAGLCLMRQAVTTLPSIANRLVLASRLAVAGREEEALLHYAHVPAEVPHHVGALVGSGHAQAELDQLDDAQASFRRAISLCPHHAEAHFLLGCVLVDEGRFAQAARHLKASLKLHYARPADAWAMLAKALQGQGQTARAAVAAAKALDIDRRSTPAREVLLQALSHAAAPVSAAPSPSHSQTQEIGT